jgi:branched-chain amino acid transport system permease protein
MRTAQYVLTGLSAGSLYALVALGIVLVYRATRVLNFAHGDVATFGTFVALAILGQGVPFGGALLLSLLAGAGLAVAFYAGVLVPAQRRDANLLGQVILTLGLALILQGVVTAVWTAEPLPFPFPISDTRTVTVRGVVVSHLALATLGVGVVGSLLLYLLVQRTRRRRSGFRRGASSPWPGGSRRRSASWPACSWRRRCCSIRSSCSIHSSRPSPQPCSAG